MVKQRTNVLTIVDYWVRDFNNPATARLFFRALLLLTFIKIVILWPFSHNVMIHHNITLPASWIGKLVFAPSFLANVNVDIFYGVSLVFLIIAFLLRPHYLTTGLFFWLTFNLYIVNLPFANGADLVLFMLAFWCIPLASTPTFKSETLIIVQKALYNSGITFLQLQIVFIYLVSGWDKLNSETWRTGEAIDYITHLSNLFNPVFVGVIDDPSVQLVLSWITIIFELSFVILIWFDKTRIPVLAIGVLFHLFIWIVMSLPDFATVMIISYIIFLKDSDYQQLPPRLRQLLL